jgi:hypothetical protein
MAKHFLAITIMACALLSVALLTTHAEAAGNSTSFSIAEKDLVHFYAPSPNPAVPCASFTSSGLPKNASFDNATGLFTWLPDFGTAGSYTVGFGCADDPALPGTGQIKIDVAPAVAVNLQSGTPKVTLVSAKTPANASQDNDQKSLASMLGVYGLSVAPVDDLAAAFTAGSVGGILVVPSYLAQSLSPATVQQVVAYVNAGGSILLFGRSPLSEALGISYSGTPLVVTQFIDYLNPKMALTWSAGESVEPFAAQASDSILSADKVTLQPLVIGRSCGKGRLLYVGTSFYDHFSVYGTKGHPYLLYHFMDAFRLKPQLSAASIDAYFDPGNYDLSKVYIEDIVRSWADRGITTVYAAAWHYWINEQTGVEWTFGYQHFIDVCHLWGIKVYPWFAIPHVSQKFWFTNKLCREQTAGAGETYAFWRLNVNLQNQDCLNSVLSFVDEVLNSYDWDGVNLAEIYYDFENSIKFFTPMNIDFRNNYAAISGFDPIAFFDTASSYYYINNPLLWTQFLQYRTDQVTALHKTFMDSIFLNPKIAGQEVILTAVDSLHSDYYDLNFPSGLGFFGTGVDLPGILRLLATRDYTLQVEDPWPFWSSNPFRYEDFKKTYLEQFPKFKADDTTIMFDVNVVNEAHNPLAGPLPLYDFPTAIQTGQEFSLLLKNMISDNQRLALFSENSVEAVDSGRLKWALAGDSVFNRTGDSSASFTTKRTTKLEVNPTYYSVYLDGKIWPAWTAVDSSVLLPLGSHQLAYRTDQVYTGIKLSGISCSLLDAGIIPGGITANYNSPHQKAVLTVEAFDKLDAEPFSVKVDGATYNATVYPFYGQYRVFLPKGRHTVQIAVVHALNASNSTLDGAIDISLNAPISVTFSNPIDPASLTAATFVVRDADNKVVSGSISYDANSMTATFTPALPLASGSGYSVTVSGVTDIYGHAMTAAKNLGFTTDSYGDINNNKKVDIAAALKYLRVAVGLDAQPNLNLAQIIIAPINRATGKPQPQAGRSKVNLQDALAALERVVGLW